MPFVVITFHNTPLPGNKILDVVFPSMMNDLKKA
jgi:hypothetical protein